MIYNTLFSCRVEFGKQLNSRNFLYDAIEEGTDIVDGPRDFTEADLLKEDQPKREKGSEEEADLIVKSLPPQRQ